MNGENGKEIRINNHLAYFTVSSSIAKTIKLFLQ